MPTFTCVRSLSSPSVRLTTLLSRNLLFVELHQFVQTLDRRPPSHGLEEPLGELREVRI